MQSAGWNEPQAQYPYPPTWGPGPGDGWGAPVRDDAEEPRRVGGTIAAHLVLWIGLLVVAAGLNRALRPMIEAGFPYRITFTVSAVVSLVPVAAALVLAGRSAVLRITGGVASLVLIGLSVLFVFSPGDFETAWVVRVAAYVFGLGTWMVVRRHARLGLLMLVPLAVVLLLWFPSWGPAPQVVSFARDRGVTSPFLLSLWFYLPIVVTALLGLVSSLLRPRPTRSGDTVGWAVVGGLAGLLAITVIVNQVV